MSENERGSARMNEWEWARICENEQEWARMSENEWEWVKMSENEREWVRKSEPLWEWVRMSEIGQERARHWKSTSERESACDETATKRWVCVCVCVCACVCVCVWERDRQSERERERKCVQICCTTYVQLHINTPGTACDGVCVCVREREYVRRQSISRAFVCWRLTHVHTLSLAHAPQPPLPPSLSIFCSLSLSLSLSHTHTPISHTLFHGNARDGRVYHAPLWVDYKNPPPQGGVSFIFLCILSFCLNRQEKEDRSSSSRLFKPKHAKKENPPGGEGFCDQRWRLPFVVQLVYAHPHTISLFVSHYYTYTLMNRY